MSRVPPVDHIPVSEFVVPASDAIHSAPSQRKAFPAPRHHKALLTILRVEHPGFADCATQSTPLHRNTCVPFIANAIPPVTPSDPNPPVTNGADFQLPPSQ